MDEKLRDIWNDLRAHSNVLSQEKGDYYFYCYLAEMAISELLAKFQVLILDLFHETPGLLL